MLPRRVSVPILCWTGSIPSTWRLASILHRIRRSKPWNRELRNPRETCGIVRSKVEAQIEAQVRRDLQLPLIISSHIRYYKLDTAFLACRRGTLEPTRGFHMAKKRCHTGRASSRELHHHLLNRSLEDCTEIDLQPFDCGSF